MDQDDTVTTPSHPRIVDKRPPILGALSQHAKTWMLAGLTVIVLIVIVTSGGTPGQPVTRPAPTSLAGLTPSPERVRDYQERLRELNARIQPPPPEPVEALEPRIYSQGVGSAQQPAPPVDPLATERARKEYESLFATNRVPLTADAPRQPTAPPALPTMDEVARAVTRAAMEAAGQATTQTPDARPQETRANPAPTRQAGPNEHTVFEGTVIDGVLTNRLEGSFTGPVNVLVTTPVYAQDLTLVIPAGARVLGTSRQVQAVGDTRLAVAFHRVILPNGRDLSIDQFVGMNQAGDVGLRDQVNRHYLSTFGAAGAIGLITGFAQWLGSGLGRDYGGTVIIAGNIGDSTAQATSQTMNRFLNRLPTITIREGHRVAVYLTSDLHLPPYGE